jgi:hypothetical protein
MLGQIVFLNVRIFTQQTLVWSFSCVDFYVSTAIGCVNERFITIRTGVRSYVQMNLLKQNISLKFQLNQAGISDDVLTRM